MQRKLHLLFIHDDLFRIGELTSLFRELDYELVPREAQTREAVSEALSGHTYDAVLCEFSTRVVSTTIALEMFRESGPAVPPFLIVARKAELQTAQSALRAGAADFLITPDSYHLVAAVLREISTFEEKDQLRRVNKSLTHRLQRAQLIQRLYESFQGLMDMPSIFQHVEENFPSLLHVDRASIFLHDGNTGTLVSDPLLGLARPEDRGAHFTPQPIGHSISGKCFRDNHPVIVNDCANSDIIPQRFVDSFELKSCIAIPIAAGNRPCGVLRLDDTKKTDRFQIDDLGYYATLGQIIGPAVENAWLYTRIKLAEAGMRTLNEELEQRVRERTKELARANEELLTEVETRKRAEEEVRTLSLQDPLTGLNNRRGFFTLVEQQLRTARRSSSLICLLYIDLDNLKIINDTFGHAVGDEALVGLSSTLDETFRETDIIARMGGDEFVVCSIQETPEHGEIMIERLSQGIERWNNTAERPYALSATIGLIKAAVTEETSLDDLLAEADNDMYLRKKSRR